MPVTQKRRSSRLQLNIPLAVAGVDGSGVPFKASAKTITVSKHGAKIRSNQMPLSISRGMALELTVLAVKQRSKSGRVVWVVRDDSKHEYGVELDSADGFWGVFFPVREADGAAAKAATAPRPSAPKPAPRLPIPPAPAPARAPLGVPRELKVQVSGFSGTRALFQEDSVLALFGPDEGVVLLRATVEVGITLRVRTGPEAGLIHARVTGIDPVRRHNKWPTRLKFSQPLLEA